MVIFELYTTHKVSIQSSYNAIFNTQFFKMPLPSGKDVISNTELTRQT